ncbi:MAG: hypothetical protein JXB03_03805 [Spirochaetales bacterium]|nr:hypothetical protein [Spirochaetales bacterium]
MKELEYLAKRSYPQDKKNVYIDIDLDRYTDLYEEWDFSPQKKRDLDQDLFTYLIECSREIPLKRKVIIRMHLPESIRNNEKEKNAVTGIQRYFAYQYQKNAYLRKKSLRSLVLYGGFGLLFLSGGVLLQNQLGESPIATILNEGLIIGGWVLFWECFDIVFFKDAFHRETMKHQKRLITTNVRFEYHERKPV